MPSAKSRRRVATRLAAEDERIALLRANAAEMRWRRLATRAPAKQNEREEAPPEEEVSTAQELAESLQEMVAAEPEGDTSESSSNAADETDDNDAPAESPAPAPRNDHALTMETRLAEVASQVQNIADVTEANRAAISTTEATMASLLETVHSLAVRVLKRGGDAGDAAGATERPEKKAQKLQQAHDAPC